MRRSGSSSCMLRPRMESTAPSPSQVESLSVTMISREELPSYSTERFYMLSELHLHSHSIRFVTDLGLDHSDINADFPPFLIVYALWRPPENERDVAAFTSEIIVPAVLKIQSHVDVVRSTEDKKPVDLDAHDNNITGSPSSSCEDAKTRLYLVVELPAHHHHVQTMLAEELAKHVASHSLLRSIFQGITVGIANHKRAAPALEACLEVVNYGAPDRRKQGANPKSHIGLIAIDPDDLLGLDEDRQTDAAQNVLQTRISTEWNGKGDLKSFGHRAHAMWRRDSGLQPQSPDFPLKQGTARRLRRLNQEFNAFPIHVFLNIGAFLLMAYYVFQWLAAGQSPVNRLPE